eukprot:5937857-Pyramimonas_sp.AAC.1
MKNWAIDTRRFQNLGDHSCRTRSMIVPKSSAAALNLSPTLLHPPNVMWLARHALAMHESSTGSGAADVIHRPSPRSSSMRNELGGMRSSLCSAKLSLERR